MFQLQVLNEGVRRVWGIVAVVHTSWLNKESPVPHYAPAVN